MNNDNKRLSGSMHIENCHCTPRIPQQLDHHNLILRGGGKASSRKLSPTGCNGPRHGIETHPQGLKCWTCGERADADDCSDFSYYANIGPKEYKASGNSELGSDQLDYRMSTTETVIDNQKHWSKECLKNDKYCVVQLIVDHQGNKRKYL